MLTIMILIEDFFNVAAVAPIACEQKTRRILRLKKAAL
jgi:hypothetical protein